MENSPHTNQVLDGYRLIRFLGRGGFGEVWLCRSESMGGCHALKFIAGASPELLEKEYQSLALYRKEAAKLRSPHLIPIEHINRNEAGLYYVMPLADGIAAIDPCDPAWQPLSLAAKVREQAATSEWFTSQEIIKLIRPVLEALQTLSDSGLVHRDVKPENILFFNGEPCLGDISLLGEDASIITRRGTPGYGTPSWYVGGHPDMYGAAATLFHLLTGNLPDKMGRSAFLWPPQGEASLSASERAEWKRLHAIIRRATEEKVAERFTDFATMARGIGMAGDTGIAPHAKSRLSPILLTSLVVTGAAAAIAFAGFRNKQPKTVHPPIPTRSQTASDPAPELTVDQKADYQALAGMVQGYLSDGNYANALASVESLLSTYPQSRTQPAYSIARAMALKGLGRIDEAKAELRKDVNLSPNITAMDARKNLWEEFGDLDAAEKDITRILDKYGPCTFPLFLRADIRAKRENFAGVHADRQAAYASKPEELEQRRLVDTMWIPLETKYPGYRKYLKTLPPDPHDKAVTPGNADNAHDDAWILEVFDSIMSDIAQPNSAASAGAMRARTLMKESSRDGFEKGDYAKCLGLLDQAWYSIPVLGDSPVLSLFRSLLLKRLGRQKESGRELVKLCHRDGNPRLIDARVCLLSALDRKREAEELLTRMSNAIKPADDPSGKLTLQLLMQRARIRAILGDFPGVRADHLAALALVDAEATVDSSRQRSGGGGKQNERNRQSIQAAWDMLRAKYPGYGEYLKTLPEK